MKKLILSFLSLATVICSQSGPAQAVPDPQFLVSAEEELLFQDISSVYTASKYEQKISDAPARISIVTQEEIQRYGYRTFADILRSLPGFYISYDNNYSYVGVRGFGIPGDYNTRILMLVNGHRINDNIFDSVYADTAFILDLDLIDRVEVVRGPSSSLYGSNAFFGVVNVITKKGRDLDGLETSVAVGSHRSYQGRLSYGKRYQNGLELLLSGSYYDSQGRTDLYYKEFDDPTTNNGVAEEGDDDQFNNLFFRLSSGDFTLESLYADREKGIPTAPWDVEFNNSETRTWDGHWFVDLNYQHLHESGMEIAARLFYDNYWYDGDYLYDYGPPSEIVTLKDRDIGEWWGTELHVSRHFFESHRLTLGGEYRGSLKQEQKTYDRYDLWLDSQPDIDTWALFFQDEWTLLDNLLFNIGLRHDNYDSFGGTTNPRVALIYSLFPETSLKFLYGKAFRAPSTYELYYHDGYNTAKPNTHIDPETIESIEFIWEQQLNRNLRSAVSLYKNEIEGLIAYTLDPDDGLFYFDNQDDVEAYGAELSIEGKWNRGCLTNLSYTYQHAESKDTGERLVNSPRHMVKVNVMAPVVNNILNGGLELQYESGRKTVAGNETDNSLLTNLILVSNSWLEGVTVSAGVYNLFDVAYDFPGSAEHRQDMLLQDGRTFKLKIDYLF
ncbi:MAG: TonB-dependent receptor [Proteobacteria bacterium]|nr:TonB-dependent receptor [Pseudomonadota bacterium]